jgi:hypothetical protein
MDRSVVVRGNRVITQNFLDSMSQRDSSTGVYKLYTEYYSDNTTKFVEISLAEPDGPTRNYLKAVYTRYNSEGNIAETRTIDLKYIGRALIDTDNAIINNDFYSNDKLETILNSMVNIAGMEFTDQAHADRLTQVETNVSSLHHGTLSVSTTTYCANCSP